jgi:hypothetical protein
LKGPVGNRLAGRMAFMPTSEMSMSRTKTPTNTIEAAANPPVTLTPEALKNLIDEVTALRAAVANAAKPSAANGKTDISAKNDLACIRVFKRAGFKDLQPRINILTFPKWIEHGYRPVEKSKALKVNNLRLWHVSQVRPLTKDEIKTMKAQPADAEKRQKSGKVIPISGEASPQ